MKRVAIITARGQSKRIPRKNIKDFLGKPVIAYSIKAALDSGVFDEVYVSTEDSEIAEVSVKYGAKVPFMRSLETADDYATTNDVLMEFITECKKRNIEFETACCLYPTAPFVTGERLKEAVTRLEESGAETLIPVVAFSYPPQRAMVIREGRLDFLYKEYMDSRSQDLEKHYHDVGQFYIFKTDAFMKNKKLMVGDILPFELDELEVQDIDNETDWKLAEQKYRFLYKEN
ncbi:MAG: pseudaminic acid cytidylyltransferase [Lachnospiraceae bacterium]|nr:pseudaminic acid cytidylyltransferase [Lachnospiraceae bacterium]